MTDDRERIPVSVAWILLAALGAALVVTNLMRSSPAGPTASFPVDANGLPVVTVVDAIDLRAADDARDIAVSGWLQAPFAHSRPAPIVPLVPVIEGPCALTGFLMAEPESIVHVQANSMEMSGPTGPAIETVFDGPGTDWARPLPREGDAVPTPAVLIGHFDDARAAGCQPENQETCRDRFVVLVVAWADGSAFP